MRLKYQDYRKHGYLTQQPDIGLQISPCHKQSDRVIRLTGSHILVLQLSEAAIDHTCHWVLEAASIIIIQNSACLDTSLYAA